MAFFNIPIIDYAGKKSVASFPVDDAIADLNLTALFTAVGGMTRGNIDQTALNIATPKNAGPGGAPANEDAQREMKWLVEYHDTVVPTDTYTLEIPCADAALISGNTVNMDTGAGAGATFKTQFEATVKAPRTGNAVAIDQVILIGKNI